MEKTTFEEKMMFLGLMANMFNDMLLARILLSGTDMVNPVAAMEYVEAIDNFLQATAKITATGEINFDLDS